MVQSTDFQILKMKLNKLEMPIKHNYAVLINIGKCYSRKSLLVVRPYTRPLYC